MLTGTSTATTNKCKILGSFRIGTTKLQSPQTVNTLRFWFTKNETHSERTPCFGITFVLSACCAYMASERTFKISAS